METYTILLSREEDIPQRLAKAVGEILDRSESVVSRAFRDHPWLPLLGVPADLIDPVFDLLIDAGVPAKAVPDVHMPRLPTALRVRDADPLPNAFFLQVAEPPAPAAVPWDQVRLISAGRVTLSPEETEAVYGGWKGPSLGSRGMSTPGSAPLNPVRDTPEPYLLDLTTGGEEPLRLGIDAGNFKYDYLKDRMKPASRENFRQLLADIRELTPHAEFSRTALSVLAGEPAASHRFRSLRAYGTYTLWYLQALDEKEASEAPAP